MYDYLIVGAGLYGAVFAQQMMERGKRCLVIDKRDHPAGNLYTEEQEGIQVHQYGPHIFHTDNERVWNYIQNFAQFNHFIYTPIANYKGSLYNLPFNMHTFVQMWKVQTPAEAAEILADQIRESGIAEPQNLEEQALSLVGRDIYEMLIKGYTEKQWGRPCRELPASIIKRLPVRMTFDNNYFDHPHQGIPIGGYTQMVKRMLEGADLQLGVDFQKDRDYLSKQAKCVVYTGPIDDYFSHCYGALQYRSLRFETEVLDAGNYQGIAGMNFTDGETPYTRIIEHKHFEFGVGNPEKTVITREYPQEWKPGEEPYYPINDVKNTRLYEQYRLLAKQEPQVRFGGRLATYQYLDMDQTIAQALEDTAQEARRR